MRRPNGTGSIIKLKGKRRKPYAVRVSKGYGVNRNGNESFLYEYIGFYEKHNEALAALDKWNSHKTRQRKQKSGQAPRLHFWEIYDLWLQEKLNKATKPSKSAIAGWNLGYKHLAPLHDMIFEDICLYDLEDAIAPYKTMSKSTTVKCTGVLHGMYKYALRHDLVEKDYSALLEIDVLNENARPHTCLTEDEIRLLWAHADNRDVQYVLILIYTGMRINELLDQQTDQIFLDKRYMIGGSKTDAGKDRVIPLHECIVPFIQTDHNYLAINENTGRKFSYSAFVDHMAAALSYAGLTIRHTPHDTRHSFATLLDEAGVTDFHKKLIMGHSVTDITNGVYTHVKPEILVEDVNRIKVANHEE